MFTDFIKKLKLWGLEYFGKYYACYRGFVADNNDPEEMGRLKIKVPQIYKNDYDYWANPKGMYFGSYFIPKVGDSVWIAFENGDSRFPIWEYGWWSKNQKPQTASLTNKVIETESGIKISLNDENKIISLVSTKGISIGTESGSKEAAILGDTLKEKLEEITNLMKDICNQCALITVVAPLTPPVNAPLFTALTTQISTFQTSLNTILSEIVTLD